MCEQQQRCECCNLCEITNEPLGFCIEYEEPIADIWAEGEFCEEFEEL